MKSGGLTFVPRKSGVNRVIQVTPACCPPCARCPEAQNAEQKTKKQSGLPILHLPQLAGLALGFDEEERELQRHIMPTAAVGKVKVDRLS
jgi:heterodisulfide reductase subunit B